LLRAGFDTLGEMGETGYRSTVGTLLAEALLRLGREEEALEVVGRAEELAQPDDVDPQVRCRTVRARILARSGRHEEAAVLAREAVAIAAATDYLVLHAGALRALADVLRAAGDDASAAGPLTVALELYERKEHRVLADETRALLAGLTAGYTSQTSPS
jgi:tetratricopeptide (TPR) repeat protein